MSSSASAAPPGRGAARVGSARAHVAVVPDALPAGRRPSAHDADERTRDRVLNAVLEHGPISAAELGDLLGFTPAAVRRHLDHLARTRSD